MLVSHRKHFIFTKTAKTAGTSVESYFEPWCMPEGEWTESHARDEYESEAGIIGFRGRLGTMKKTWWNHMPAARIRELVGVDVWDSYFKFTVVRNPFDKMVSGYSMFERMRKKGGWPMKWQGLRSKLLRKGRAIDRARGRDDVERFRDWVRLGGVVFDRDKYVLDDVECVDHFIRFEDLATGIEEVCERLELPFDPTRVPTFKTGQRKDAIALRDWYDEATERRVAEAYAWEIERFGYTLDGASRG